MIARMNMQAQFPEVYRAMGQLDRTVAQSGIEPALYELIKIRASQLNKCAYCIDQHTRTARQEGETEQRIYALSAWRETPFFSYGEQAALALTEAITLLPEQGVPEALYKAVIAEYGESGTARIIMAITTINAWNRIGVSTGMQPVASGKE